jgi:hypothetical protein
VDDLDTVNFPHCQPLAKVDAGLQLRVALFHVDCNAYAAENASMDISAPYMAPRGLITSTKSCGTANRSAC